MADSNALARAKKQAMLDSVLTTNIADQEAPALALLNKLMQDSDYEMYNNTLSTVSIVSFEEGTSELYTRCNTNIAGMQSLKEDMEIQIITTTPDTTYNGYFRIFNLDLVNYSFEIRKIFSVTKTAAATITRKTDLENAHAYLILYLLVSSAQELVSKQVLYNSQGFGDGNISQAGIETKQTLADSYYSKARQFLGYCYSEAL